jgi:hypothetical protein
MGGTIHVTRTAGETEVQPNTKLSRATIYRDKALGLIPVALNIAIRPKSYWIDMKYTPNKTDIYFLFAHA